MRKKYLILAFAIILVMGFASTTTALELNPFAETKTFIKDVQPSLDVSTHIREDYNPKYGVITLRSNFLWIGTGKTAEYSLTKNTELCLVSCEAEGRVTLYSDGILFNDKKFINTKDGKDTTIKSSQYYIFEKYVDNYVTVPDTYTEVCIDLPTNKTNLSSSRQCTQEVATYKQVNQPKEVWTPYNGEQLKAGNYRWKITGTKDAMQSVDFIPIVNSKQFNEWAVWNSSFNVGLKSYFTFNETSGTLWSDSLGINNITLGNLHNSSGIVGGAYGSANGNNYNDTGSSTSTGQYTINLWVRRPSQTGDLVLFGSRKPGGSNANGLLMMYAQPDGSYIVSACDSTGYVEVYTSYHPAPSATVWSMITATYNSTTLAVYVDGALWQKKALSSFNGSTTTVKILGAVDGTFKVNGWQIDELGTWNRTLTPTEILDLNSSLTYVPDILNIVPVITFINQTPEDITVTNVVNTTINIVYNITHASPINLSQTNLFWLTNGTANRNFTWYVNGTIPVTGFTSTGVRQSNISNQFTFLMGDNVYPATYLINLSIFQNSPHLSNTDTTLDNDNKLIKALVMNMSNNTSQNLLEYMISNLTSTVASLRIYYCNSTYTNGNIDTSSSCALVANMPNSQTVNHIENQSKHYLMPLIINQSTGTLAGIKITPASGYFIFRGRTGGWNASYVSTIARTSAVQTSINTGTTYSDLAGTLDYHLHQFSEDSSFNYYVCSNSTLNGIYNCSTTRTDFLNRTLTAPSPPIVTSPLNTTYNTTVPIGYLASIPAVGSNISYYNISLYNADDSYNQTLIANNGLNLNYTWNNTLIPIGQFNIHVMAIDINGFTAFGESELFNLYNPTNTSTSVVATPASPITYGTANTFDCSNTGALPTSMYINGINRTSEKGVSITRSAGAYLVNCTALTSSDGAIIGSSQQITYIINKASSTNTLAVSPSNNENYGTTTTVTGSNCPSQLSCSLTENGASVANPRIATLNAGTYYYNYTSNSNENYTAVTNSLTLTINKINPTLAILITPSSTVTNGTTTTATGIGCPDGSCVLRRDGVIVGNPDSSIFPVGSYLYNYSYGGSTNYNTYSILETLIVNPVQFAGTNGSMNFTPTNLSNTLSFQVPFRFVTKAMMNLTGLNRSIGNSQCYQETATTATACGGLSTGNYSFANIANWADPANTYDANWATFGINTGALSSDSYYVNYAKPLDASGAVLQLKDVDGIFNVTIPSDCWSYTVSSNTLSIRAISSDSITPSNQGALWYCANSSTTFTHLINHTGAGKQGEIYEEGVYWNMTDTYPSNVNVTQGNSQIYYNAGTLSSKVNTGNFYSIINNYLATCTYIGNYCVVPLTFTSATSGKLNYSEAIFSNEGFIDNGITYTSPVVEGSTNQIIANISFGIVPNVVTLVYNNVNYTPIIVSSGYNYRLISNVTAPIVSSDSNISFYYNFLINGTTYISDSRNQSILNSFLSDNCTSGYSFINITNYDEETLQPIIGTVEYTLSLLNDNNQVSSLSGNATGYNIAFCNNQNLSSSYLRYALQLRYYSNSTVYKTYNIQSSPTSDLPLILPLYFLNNSVGVSFKINYVDFYYLKYPNAIIQIQRQYLNNNTYHTVEVPLIDDDGQALGSFNTNNVKYNIVIIKDGSIIDIFNNVFPACQNVVLSQCEINLRGVEAVSSSTVDDFTYTLTKTNTSIILAYIIPSGTPRNIQFKTNQNSRFLENISNCDSSLFSSGGSISCGYNVTVGDSLISLEIINSDGSHLFGNVHVSEDLSSVYLLNNYFIAFILVLSLLLMFVGSGTMQVLTSIVSIVFLGLIFLIRGIDSFIASASLGWIVVAGSLVIYSISKKEERT